jgi:hypothetical protein
LLLLIKLDRPIPPGVNIIWNLGLGGRTLLGQEQLPSAPIALWWLWTLAGTAATGAGLAVLGRGFWKERGRLGEYGDRVLLVVFPLVYVGVLSLRMPFFDRYLLPVLPAAMALLLAFAPQTPRPRALRAAAAVALVATGLYAVTGTRDYLTRHRVRNAVLAELEAQGIGSDRIDGGFEYSGWRNYSVDRMLFKLSQHIWVIDDEYVLSYSPHSPGYEILTEREYTRWLPPGREQLRVLRRIPIAEASGS